ncbi:hypothetical protein AB0E08_15065 [Streptomyces sp. NPDC048281]|uniref:hypothetical protein n=1 Tax=Streptomyces sp. NPDC048281 TaxID=3154715 RepID=UPI00343499BD
MPKYSDADYAVALNSLLPGRLPKRGEKVRVMIGDDAADVPIGNFLKELRRKGRKRAFERELTAALLRHGLTPSQAPNGQWMLPQLGTVWQDTHYAAALDSRPPGNLPKRGEKVRVMIGNDAADVPIGTFLSDLRSLGRKRAFEPELTAALLRHGLTPSQAPNRRWTVPQTGTRLGWQDTHYAAALDSRLPGDLPKWGETVQVKIGDFFADVSIGTFLSDLRSRGRRRAFEPELTAALQRHGLTPSQTPNGRRTVPQTGTHLTWQDTHYAAALNSRPPGHLPKWGETVQVKIGDFFAGVPIGNFLKDLRSKGRTRAFEPELTAALQRHGLTPSQTPNRRWMVPQTDTRMTWQDTHYAAALNSRPPGHLPKRHEKVRVMIGNDADDVPIGNFLSDLRSRGRKRAFEPELTAALQQHGLYPVWQGDSWKISTVVPDTGSVNASYGPQQYPQNPAAPYSYHDPAQVTNSQVAALSQGMEQMPVAVPVAPTLSSVSPYTWDVPAPQAFTGQGGDYYGRDGNWMNPVAAGSYLPRGDGRSRTTPTSHAGPPAPPSHSRSR